MGSISYHIMLLVINSLGGQAGSQTDRHTDRQTDTHSTHITDKDTLCWPATLLVIDCLGGRHIGTHIHICTYVHAADKNKLIGWYAWFKKKYALLVFHINPYY